MIRIAELAPRDVEEAVALFERVSFGPGAWLPSGESALIPHMAREALATALAKGRGWIARGPHGVEGVATFRSLAWDTAFFGVRRGLVPLFAAEAEAIRPLAEAITRDLRGAHAGHVHTLVDARQFETLDVLQACGWRLAASAVRIVAPSQRIDPAELAWPPDTPAGLECVPYAPEHLEPLLEIARRLGPMSWLQRETRLPEGPRRAYTTEMTRNCLTSDFADEAVVLLDRGRPVGVEAGKIFSLPPARSRRRYTFERVAFIDPACRGRRLGGLLLRCYIRAVMPHADYLTGRVLLENAPMMRSLYYASVRPVHGQHYLVLR
ncbi:MAG: hypothetical protein ACQEXJ_22030 [Myxococcota bacterium]